MRRVGEHVYHAGRLEAIAVDMAELLEVTGERPGMAGDIDDALGAEFRTIRIRRDAGCALCGDNPTISDLSAHLHVAPETA